MNEILHYGVPGMKWGVRKDAIKSSVAKVVKNKSQTAPEKKTEEKKVDSPKTEPLSKRQIEAQNAWKNRDNMTDQELYRVANALNAETTLKNAMYNSMRQHENNNQSPQHNNHHSKKDDENSFKNSVKRDLRNQTSKAIANTVFKTVTDTGFRTAIGVAASSTLKAVGVGGIGAGLAIASTLLLPTVAGNQSTIKSILSSGGKSGNQPVREVITTDHRGEHKHTEKYGTQYVSGVQYNGGGKKK